MFTKETIPAEIPVLKDYADYLCYNCIPADKPASQMSLEELHQDQPSWDIASMIRGLNRLSEIAADGPCLYNVYTPDESSDCPEKKRCQSLVHAGKRNISIKKPLDHLLCRRRLYLRLLPCGILSHSCAL